eukprot:Hpha_TRINITY_DN16189_c5_g2::TRINITY_DN16189_c5_g2_i1::g.5337::m.5337
MSYGDRPGELIKAFAVFDHDKSGKVPVQALRLVLTQLADKLTDEEVSELIAEGDTHCAPETSQKTENARVSFRLFSIPIGARKIRNTHACGDVSTPCVVL